MEIARGIIVPVQPDQVLSPDVYYGRPVTGIYFITEEDHYGRITFEKLDAIKISRGEWIPFEDDWEEEPPYCWVWKVDNSAWQTERYQYEKRFYGSAYEFGGNVDEMLTDFNHFVFLFHDQFVEAIAKGFWYETSDESLFGKELTKGHPFLPLPENNSFKIQASNLICQVRTNPAPIDELKKNAEFCSQKLFEFALELDGEARVDHALILTKRMANISVI